MWSVGDVATKQILYLSYNISDYGSILDAKIEICKAQTSIQSILSNIENIFSFIASTKGLCLSIDVKRCDYVSIYQDARRVKQVIYNLLMNAVKYTKSGTVTLRLQNSIRNHINFSVTDSGIGMTQDQVDNTFSRFEDISLTDRP